MVCVRPASQMGSAGQPEPEPSAIWNTESATPAASDVTVGSPKQPHWAVHRPPSSPACSRHPEQNPVPTKQNLPFPQPAVTPSYFCLQNFASSTQDPSFCVWRPSLSMRCPRSIRVLVWISTAFCGEKYPVARMYRIFFSFLLFLVKICGLI